MQIKIRPNFNNLPLELIELSQWVLWKYEDRNGKKTKVPYQYDGTPAQANNRSTWSTYHTIKKFFLEGDYDGIGFVFSERDNFIGVDIDNCVDNGKINEFAQSIIDELDSYTEISVSGTGVHIIVRGEMPKEIKGTGKKNTKNGIEIYRFGRYFSMSGDIESNDQIYERTDELTEIFDKYFEVTETNNVQLKDYAEDKITWTNEELWQRMFNSKNGHDIQDLYNGESLSGDHSSDDLALCNHLAFWTAKSATRMDSMFRETGLMRDKWDVIHFTQTGETYGERTIATAISSTSSTILEVIGSHKEDGWWYVNPNGTRTLQHNKIANYIIKNSHFVRFPSEHGEIYFFNEKQGVYEEDASGRRLRSIIRKLEPELRAGQVKEVTEYLKDMAPVKREVSTDVIALNNGLLDLKTFELKSFNPNYFVRAKIYTNYNPNAHDDFVESTLQKVSEGYKPTIENIKEIFACVLYPGLLVPKMFYLYGRSAHNGKSSLINMIQYTFNKKGNSISAVTPQRLATNSFASASMYGKLANIVDDQPDKLIEDSGILKTVLTGGVVEIERKGKNSESVRLITTMITASNFYPNFAESGNQINRRLYIIPFEHNFSLDKDVVSDAESMEKLKSKSACEYVLKMAVDALQRMLSSDLPDKMTSNSKVEEMSKGFADFNDPMSDYFAEFNKDYFEEVPGVRTYNDYLDWAKENGAEPFDMKRFKELVMKEHDFEWKAKKIKINDTIKTVKGFKSKKVTI